ncbi:MAG: 16S rRNA (guanine(966)-N(2))-methyltransferase RsmD [Ornithinibacter sp.]
MTRIISGTAGGRSLRTPSGSGTRPTSERVREAIFSALQSRDALAGSRVVDLYAGSGALGLEAASRGSESVLLVESDARAVSVIRDNIAALGLPAAQVTRQSVLSVVSVPPSGGTVSLALLDPPYSLGEDDLALVLQHLVDRWLDAEALVVIERSTRSPEPSWPEVLARLGKGRRYGETTVWFAETR